MNLNFSAKEQEPSESEWYHLLYFLLFTLKTLPCCTCISKQVFAHLSIYTWALHSPQGLLWHMSLYMTCVRMASFTHCTRTTLIWSQMQIFYMLPYPGGKWTNCLQSCCNRKEKGSSSPCHVIRPSKASYWVYLPIYKFSSSWWGVMVPETIRLGLACTFSICELIRGCGRLSISSFTGYCQNAQLLQQLIAELLGQYYSEILTKENWEILCSQVNLLN